MGEALGGAEEGGAEGDKKKAAGSQLKPRD